MADIIQLLPDFVANQIAAGEVIQRPASVVKELMENAVDAGASNIQLIVKDSGRTLIQVVDDGCGMSASDARLCFERHATSKIASSEDLFRIRTKGFRGEAMASIASVAQVELKTRQRETSLGTLIQMDGSEVKRSEPCQQSEGSSIAVKNLFFNVPARRQFLKSDQVELRHIFDEFQRLALAHPEVAMVFHHNQSEVHRLKGGTLRQRITGLFGSKYDERLVPVEENTDVVRITGFVGKPEFARKKRGEQFFFVNGRFIKHPYLHHAVTGAMEGLLSDGRFPMYFLHLEVDPSRLDVNIHPTKTEVKFREERAIYPILKSSVRRGLGKFQVAPTLDFEQESSMNLPEFDRNRPLVMPEVKVNPHYNPFEQEPKSGGGLAGRFGPSSKSSHGQWRDFYQVLHPAEAENPQTEADKEEALFSADEHALDHQGSGTVFQMGRTYLVSPIKSGMMVIDQQRAHERILFESYLKAPLNQGLPSQRLLFPERLQLSTSDHAILLSSLETLQAMGLEVEDFGDNEVVVHGLPAESAETDPRQMIDLVLSSLNESDDDLADSMRHKLAIGLARASSIKRGKSLSEQEMNDLIHRLFTCEVPTYSPTGKAVIRTFTPDDFAGKFD